MEIVERLRYIHMGYQFCIVSLPIIFFKDTSYFIKLQTVEMLALRAKQTTSSVRIYI